MFKYQVTAMIHRLCKCLSNVFIPAVVKERDLNLVHFSSDFPTQFTPRGNVPLKGNPC